MQAGLSPVEPDADASRVRPLPVPRPRRTRQLQVAAIVATCLLAALPAASLGAEDVTAPNGSTELAPVDSIPDAPAGGAAALDAAAATEADGEQPTNGADTDPFAQPGDVGAEIAADTSGSLAELRDTRATLDAERIRLQQRLLGLEAARERAERRVDGALEAIAGRLVQLFEADAHGRLQALIEVRDQADPELRAALVEQLAAPERALMREHDEASAAASAAGSAADAMRAEVLALGTRIGALDVVIQEREGPTPDEAQRDSGERYSVDAKLIFATGPIPGIGYWGAVSGGSMLTGWMGYAGAAVGGVGCEPPDPSFKATGQIEQGEASWYGPGFHGNTTANGEVYDQRAMTAAHKTLPFGTIVRVYSTTTARCAFVRINDRGPYIDGRIIDLSEAAAEQIGMSGVAPVQIEVWAAPGSQPDVA